MANWLRIGTGTAATITAGSGSQDVAMPGTTKAGDLVVVAVAGDISCADSVTTSGYTLAQNGTGANPGAHFAWKVLTAAETVVAVARHATVLKACVVEVFRGGDGTIANAWATMATGTSNAPNPPTQGTVAADAIVLAVAFLDDDDTTVSAYPSGYTFAQKTANTGQSSTTVGATVAIAAKVSAGATEDPAAYTMGSSDAWAAGSISFDGNPTTHTGTDTGELSDTGEASNPTPQDTDTGTLGEGSAIALSTQTDTGTLAEGLTLTAAELSAYGATLSESGSASAGTGSESKSDTETGELTEAGTGTALTSDTDTGTLAETGTGTVAGTGVDAGTLAEAPALALAHTDTGVLAEAGAGSALASGTDTGTATEGQPALAVTGVDAGTGSETVAIATATTDTGTSDDTGLVSAAASGVDTGTAAETGLGAAATADSDSAELTDDGVATQAGTTATDTDAGTLAEADAITATASDTDTGTLVDAGLGTATASGVDAGTLAEVGAPAVAVAVAEDGTLAEALAGTVAGTGTDTGTAAEAVAVALAVVDTGTLDDTGAAVASGGTAPEDTDTLTLADDGALLVTALWLVGADALTLDDAAAMYAGAPSGDGVDSGTLDDTGVVVSSVTPPVTVTVEAPSTSMTGYMAPMMGRTRDFAWQAGKERWLLREVGTVEITPVAPATPPNPFGWLAEAGDDDLVAVALLG